ncbi:MAG: DASS family sodium-coupled anion symporter [Phycisphaerae bacterium]|nr:DASS family sodium-coupled anion symporter [Phycisphaerae bacterium]
MRREGESPGIIRWIGLFAGPIVAGILYLTLPSEGLSHAGRMTLAAGAWLAIWWLTEALPIEATALAPLALFPVLGVSTMKATAAPYAEEVIFLFLGGLLLGAAMERWGLHRRLALWTMLAVGTRPRRLVAGAMLAAALLSMWVSNTATAVMMLPIGMSVTALVAHRLRSGDDHGDRSARNFGKCMMLGIAYAATIGGIATVIGTPPNTVAASFIRQHYGLDLGFAGWLKIGLPLMLVFLPATWFVLVGVVYRFRSPDIPGVRALIRAELDTLGPMSRGEIATLAVFVCAAVAWVVRVPLSDALFPRLDRNHPVLTDSGIAIFASLALFLIPVDRKRGVFVLDWATASRIPWGVLLLFGGGLTLAAAISANGVDTFIGARFHGLAGVHPFLIVLILTTIVVFTTEVGSNTAVVNIFLPICAAAAPVLGVHPFLLILPTAISASYAFMMPMGTPPNALVFASGHLRIIDMAKAGLILNLLSIALISCFMYLAAPRLLGFERDGRLERVAPASAPKAPSAPPASPPAPPPR